MTCIINLSVYPRDWPIRGSPMRRGGQCMLLTDHAPSRLAEGRRLMGMRCNRSTVQKARRTLTIPPHCMGGN
ncbi:hypothetical protein FJTKL_09625 [Diaporthe vaccinii]|uniref:Uncharacterized protein n=1 Tax=Diaporthe vaccinii TaxID=105482 RepID=A0ABR4EN50_9PEZI